MNSLTPSKFINEPIFTIRSLLSLILSQGGAATSREASKFFGRH